MLDLFLVGIKIKRGQENVPLLKSNTEYVKAKEQRSVHAGLCHDHYLS